MMPSTVGHSLAGFIIYQIAPGIQGLARWQVITLYLFAANAPDLDFVPGLVVGDPNRFHHGFSHGIGFALLFAILLSLLLHILANKLLWRNFLVFLGLYLSHLTLDYLSTDTGAPYGVPLFWPGSDAYYIAPFALFSDIHRSNSTTNFFSSLFSAHNLWSVTRELLVLFPFLLLALARRKGMRIDEGSIPKCRYR
jgi:inner membrane protein